MNKSEIIKHDDKASCDCNSSAQANHISKFLKMIRSLSFLSLRSVRYAEQVVGPKTHTSLKNLQENVSGFFYVCK